jgi:phosphotransferase system HPr-like phosphotransfer protein
MSALYKAIAAISGTFLLMSPLNAKESTEHAVRWVTAKSQEEALAEVRTWLEAAEKGEVKTMQVQYLDEIVVSQSKPEATKITWRLRLKEKKGELTAKYPMSSVADAVVVTGKARLKKLVDGKLAKHEAPKLETDATWGRAGIIRSVKNQSEEVEFNLADVDKVLESARLSRKKCMARLSREEIKGKDGKKYTLEIWSIDNEKNRLVEISSKGDSGQDAVAAFQAVVNKLPKELRLIEGSKTAIFSTCELPKVS